MDTSFHSHNKGIEVLPKDIVSGVDNVLKEINFIFSEKCARRLRKIVGENLHAKGWSNSTKINQESNISITSMNKGVALCMQTGNMSRFYADLLKLQLLYTKGKAIGAIYIIPTKSAAQKMGSNVANYLRFVAEIEIFKEIISIPVVVIGIKEDKTK